jgi:pimeloyl-ACP methyl ester carboxylesterase
VVANSFGASISLQLAGTKPALFRGLIAHEPPLFSLLADDSEIAPLLADVQAKIADVADRIASGDRAGATEQFVETVALGPGMWAKVPREGQEVMIENAPTFLDEARDPDQIAFDLAWIRGFDRPTLMTTGDQSPPFFEPVVRKIAGVLPQAKVVTIPGAGHVPHVTHPEAYIAVISAFVSDA